MASQTQQPQLQDQPTPDPETQHLLHQEPRPERHVRVQGRLALVRSVSTSNLKARQSQILQDAIPAVPSVPPLPSRSSSPTSSDLTLAHAHTHTNAQYSSNDNLVTHSGSESNFGSTVSVSAEAHPLQSNPTQVQSALPSGWRTFMGGKKGVGISVAQTSSYSQVQAQAQSNWPLPNAPVPLSPHSPSQGQGQQRGFENGVGGYRIRDNGGKVGASDAKLRGYGIGGRGNIRRPTDTYGKPTQNDAKKWALGLFSKK